MKRWVVNGQPNDLINPFDRGLTYGDGLFETIAVRDGECRFFGAHYARMVISCRRLHLPVPERNSLLESAARLIADDVTGTLKIIVTRGTGERGYRLPDEPHPSCIMGFSPETLVQSPVSGVRARVCDVRISTNPVLAGIKTLNRLEQVLARAEWSDPDIVEGVMLNQRDELVCGTMSNLFLVARDQLWTPMLDESGVHGIMRSQVMNLAGELGITCNEQRMALSLLEEADDVFVTNARVGLWPVAELDHRRYQRADITMQLRAGLAQRGVSECAQ